MRAMRSESRAKAGGNTLTAVAIQFGVGGAVDDAHAAFAGFGGDAIVGNCGGLGHECRALGIVSLPSNCRPGAAEPNGAGGPLENWPLAVKTAISESGHTEVAWRGV